MVTRSPKERSPNFVNAPVSSMTASRRFFLPSRSVRIIGKEFRELALSRSFALLLIIAGLLVGHSFITAVRIFSEMSGGGNAPAGLAQGLSPLDGILVPTFGAYEIVATFLLPFIVIRLVGAERASGGWALLLQSPISVRRSILVKFFALLAAWGIALIPGLVAVALWKSYGGHMNGAELLTVVVGHVEFGAVTIAIAMVAAAIAPQPSTAAIIALGVTVGCWALAFAGVTNGGAVADWAAFTPESVLRGFEHGLVRASVVGVMLALVVGAIGATVIRMELTLSPRERRMRVLVLIVALISAVPSALAIRHSWDMTEDRRHSFAPEDVTALRNIAAPLHVEARLAPEDPRRADLERSVLSKLRRVMRVDVTYAATTSTGMFEKPDSRYGEVWYQIGNQREQLRSTIEPIVLETIYRLAGVKAPDAKGGEEYPGYPLAATPTFATPFFYLIWPLLVVLCFAYSSGAFTSGIFARRSS
jgi:ABC-2 type transport system permease protein